MKLKYRIDDGPETVIEIETFSYNQTEFLKPVSKVERGTDPPQIIQEPRKRVEFTVKGFEPEKIVA